jgi:predicted DNA-binding transcriptional regulator AlpA
MAYHSTTRALVSLRTKQLGPRLGKAAVKHGLSVQQISALTGASRTTVYSWFAGGTVTNAYRRTVERLISSLRAPDAVQALETFTASHSPDVNA